jgi:hypothetical protein
MFLETVPSIIGSFSSFSSMILGDKMFFFVNLPGHTPHISIIENPLCFMASSIFLSRFFM